MPSRTRRRSLQWAGLSGSVECTTPCRTDTRNKGTDTRNEGTDTRNKGTELPDTRNEGTDTRNKGAGNRAGGN